LPSRQYNQSDERGFLLFNGRRNAENFFRTGICMNATATAQPVDNVKPRLGFTDNGYWTPQTAMLESIREWALGCAEEPVSAISVDVNPTLDQIVNERWPGIRIQRAVPPEHDIQRLHQIPSDRFDLGYSNQVLEHVPKPWLAGAELVRILRPGGIGIHTTCAYNPRHGLPAFNDYYRFLPDGLAELFDGVEVLVKTGWGNRQVIQCNLTIDEGAGVSRSARRFHPDLAMPNDPNYPWVTWIIFRKLVPR
jgi:SAM-dependent methyltransferase